MKFSHMDPEARKARFGKNTPSQDSVYVVGELTQMSVGFMLKPELMVANQMVPSCPVTEQSAKYAEYPRGFFFRDEMEKRSDGAESAGGRFEVNWDNAYYSEVYAYHTDAGPQMRANAKAIDVDRVCTQICTNKALLKREAFFFTNFFKAGVWTTQIQGKTSGGGGTANVDLSWADANAKPIKQIKKAIRTHQELTGYKLNRACFSAELWDTFCEHPNVQSRINAGQTPGGPSEVSIEMARKWLGLDVLTVAQSVRAANKAGGANANVLSYFDTEKDALLLTYAPATPALIEPSAYYFYDWVADGLVGSYGNAVSRWWNQDRKSLRYEIEMATDAKKVSADCGVWMYDFLAT